MTSSRYSPKNVTPSVRSWSLDTNSGRLTPYWGIIQCLELIDPSGPDLDQYTTEEVWEAAEKLGERRGIDCTRLRQEVEEVRSEFPDYDSTLKGYHPPLTNNQWCVNKCNNTTHSHRILGFLARVQGQGVTDWAQGLDLGFRLRLRFITHTH